MLEWNNLKINDVLDVGHTLIIYTDASVLEDTEKEAPVVQSNTTDSHQLVIHKVTTSDTLYSIARQYQVSIKEIMDWNQKEDFVIKQDEELKIYISN